MRKATKTLLTLVSMMVVAMAVCIVGPKLKANALGDFTPPTINSVVFQEQDKTVNAKDSLHITIDATDPSGIQKIVINQREEGFVSYHIYNISASDGVREGNTNKYTYTFEAENYVGKGGKVYISVEVVDGNGNVEYWPSGVKSPYDSNVIYILNASEAGEKWATAFDDGTTEVVLSEATLNNDPNTRIEKSITFNVPGIENAGFADKEKIGQLGMSDASGTINANKDGTYISILGDIYYDATKKAAVAKFYFVPAQYEAVYFVSFAYIRMDLLDESYNEVTTPFSVTVKRDYKDTEGPILKSVKFAQNGNTVDKGTKLDFELVFESSNGFLNFDDYNNYLYLNCNTLLENVDFYEYVSFTECVINGNQATYKGTIDTSDYYPTEWYFNYAEVFDPWGNEYSNDFYDVDEYFIVQDGDLCVLPTRKLELEIDWYDEASEDYNQETCYAVFSRGDKLKDVITAAATNAGIDISKINAPYGWYYDTWVNDETVYIDITDDLTISPYKTHLYISPYYEKINVVFSYLDEDGNCHTKTIKNLSITKDSKMGDVLGYAPSEALDNSKFIKWSSYGEECLASLRYAYVNGQYEGEIKTNLRFVYQTKSGNIKSSVVPIIYEQNKTTYKEMHERVVVPQDAAEGTKVPTIDYVATYDLFGANEEITIFAEGIGEIAVAAFLSDSEDSEDDDAEYTTLDYYKLGDTVNLPTEHQGQKVSSWRCEYYDSETGKTIKADCGVSGFTFVIPKRVYSCCFYPTYGDGKGSVTERVMEKLSEIGGNTPEEVAAVFNTESKKDELMTAMATDASVENIIKNKETAYAAANNINVSAPSVTQEAQNLGIDSTKVQATGAGLNATAGQNVTLNVDKTAAPVEVEDGYDNPVQVDIDLKVNDKEVTGSLTVPITITMPIPKGVNLTDLVIRHVHKDGTREDITNFRINDNGTITFAVKSFSTFIFANKRNEQVYEFVKRLYSVCLDRLPDDAGLASWANQLTSGKMTGSQVAAGFIFSPEFLAKEYCNSHYLEYMYKAFFNRASDEGGKNTWMNYLAEGHTRKEVFNGFVMSTEFSNLCQSYGIVLGDPVPIDDAGVNYAGKCVACIAERGPANIEGINAFVTRMYSVCLDRVPDADGLNMWNEKLASYEMTGSEVAHGFIFSDEFQGRGFSNEDYVEYMYKAFFGRASDPDGKNLWVGLLTSGEYDRMGVFRGFTGSTEFANLCSEYGIISE